MAVHFLILLCPDLICNQIKTLNYKCFCNPAEILVEIENKSHPLITFILTFLLRNTVSYHLPSCDRVSPRLWFSPKWYKQLCQKRNYLKKDVSTQVWQPSAITDMMLHNRFNKHEGLATLQWTNSSFGFLPEEFKLLWAEEAHIKILSQTS